MTEGEWTGRRKVDERCRDSLALTVRGKSGSGRKQREEDDLSQPGERDPVPRATCDESHGRASEAGRLERAPWRARRASAKKADSVPVTIGLVTSVLLLQSFDESLLVAVIAGRALSSGCSCQKGQLRASPRLGPGRLARQACERSLASVDGARGYERDVFVHLRALAKMTRLAAPLTE